MIPFARELEVLWKPGGTLVDDADGDDGLEVVLSGGPLGPEKGFVEIARHANAGKMHAGEDLLRRLVAGLGGVFDVLDRDGGVRRNAPPFQMKEAQPEVSFGHVQRDGAHVAGVRFREALRDAAAGFIEGAETKFGDADTVGGGKAIEFGGAIVLMAFVVGEAEFEEGFGSAIGNVGLKFSETGVGDQERGRLESRGAGDQKKRASRQQHGGVECFHGYGTAGGLQRRQGCGA